MKGGFAFAALAAVATGASASALHNHDHARLFANRRHADDAASVCVPGCTTVYKYITGEATLIPNPPKSTQVPEETPEVTPEATPEVTTEAEEPVTSTQVVEVIPLPTPEVKDCPTPGTYTFPATTVTVTETTVVCGAESTEVPPGVHTVGGVTTDVDGPTTITCPVAKETTHDGTVTSTIETTVYYCPSAGHYVIGAETKTVSEETVLVYPVPNTYVPGTYTAPEQTITVTKTGYKYVCPYTSQGAPTAAVTSAPKAPAAKTQKVSKPKPEENAEVEAPKPTTSAPAAAPKKKVSTAKTQKTAVSHGELKGDSDHWGITYTPYEPSNGKCKGQAAVDSDIAALKDAGFKIVRVYSTDCNTIEYVAPACAKYGLEMIIGVFVKETGCTIDTPEIKSQVDTISKWAQWDQVRLFVVGNEAIMQGYCTPKALAKLLTDVKSKCSGYTGPWTISETLNIWEQPETKKELCGVVDVTGANIHPYFNPNTPASKAGTFVKGQLDLLKDICPGNDVINLECGWPTRGKCNGQACPGKTEQAEAIKSIRASCGDKTVFFSVYDDMWKKPGDCLCEQSWGSKSCFQ